ncbi:MAG: enhanced intracellular survival protein Eis [Chloroflexia bacterium]
MRTSPDISPPEPNEMPPLEALLSAALHIPPDGTHDWLETLGRENLRAARLDGQVVAGLGLIPMGQWFGGRSVPMAGVTIVGVAPEHRGTGVGIAMMRGMLEELREQGTALSALYPATLNFYRRVGYERAGWRLTYELPLGVIDVREREANLVPAGPEQYPEFYRAYEARARQSAGNLDRPDWMWRHRLEPQDQQPAPHRFLVVRDGQVEGYIIFRPGVRTDPLRVLDVCALTPAAGRRLLTLFAGYSTMVETVTWSGGPLDPLVYLINEPLLATRFQVKLARTFEWMLRIVDVAKALEARGYPPGLSVELHFDLRDDVLPDNSGRFTLHVADGRGQVQLGGQGHIRLDACALAAIYSGHISPLELVPLGLIEGADAGLAMAGSVFAGPRPWIGEMF